jgi:RNA 2',3'-cyclic 3'-phosphodiesterase
MGRKSKTKRVFFAMECQAPWPEELPKGKIIPEESRHMTLAFLGDVDIEELMSNLEEFPKPFFDLGFTAILDKCLFFPEKRPRVAAWGVNFGNRENELKGFHKALLEWMKEYGYPVEDRDYVPHITLSRGKFSKRDWEDSFYPLPAALTNIHLFESLGRSEYRSLWEHPLFAPFTEMEHTADIAFKIRGRSTSEIYQHAAAALAFECPDILSYVEKGAAHTGLNDVISSLNHLISAADSDIGVPFKAVSYHGELTEKHHFLEWEMIVDV